MCRTSYTFLFLAFSIWVQAQEITFQDQNFERTLLNDHDIDTNGNGKIEEEEALDYTGKITVPDRSDVLSVPELIYFENLTELEIGWNDIESLDLSKNTKLISLKLFALKIEKLDISKCTELESLNLEFVFIRNLNLEENWRLKNLSLGYIGVDQLNLSRNILLEYIEIGVADNLLELDLSNQILVREVDLTLNPRLYFLNLNTGFNYRHHNYFSGLGQEGVYVISHCDNLREICVDNVESEFVEKFKNLAWSSDSCTDCWKNVNFKEGCSNCTSGNVIKGKIKFVAEESCDSGAEISLPLRVTTKSKDGDEFSTFTDSQGCYSIIVPSASDYQTSITYQNENIVIADNEQVSVFVEDCIEDVRDFCFLYDNPIKDLSVHLIPVSQARPGFTADYYLIFKNYGSLPASGTVKLEFDQNDVSFKHSTEESVSSQDGILTFEFENLKPFQNKKIGLQFKIPPPPQFLGGEVLNYIATVSPLEDDFSSKDNISKLNQTVVNSYDPNDITVLEGPEIYVEQADDYLHYVIRFQNTGTASAINVSVKNELDPNLDWESLQLESISHDNRVEIKNGKDVEFIFENIELPDSTANEPESHGYIAYKIKPKQGVSIGDDFKNTADIYFDFNEAIVTNTAVTTIVDKLSTSSLAVPEFEVFPNPTTGLMHIESNAVVEKVSVYNLVGIEILSKQNPKTIDLSQYSGGIYFLKITAVGGQEATKKVLVK